MANVIGSKDSDFVSTTFKSHNVNVLTTNDPDTVNMLGGHDSAFAGDGDDTVSGGDGNDQLSGQAGADTLFGDNGNDLLKGDTGDDNLFGGPGNDVSFGGLGNDFIQEDGTGNDRLYGGEGNDIFFGGDGNDQLYGGRGNDFMRGMGGNDLVSGGDGADAVIGDGGNDDLKGGSGADQFIFERPVKFSVSKSDRDVILDFKHGEDKITLLGFSPDAVQFSDLDIKTTHGNSVIELSSYFGSHKGIHTITVLGVADLSSTDFLFL